MHCHLVEIERCVGPLLLLCLRADERHITGRARLNLCVCVCVRERETFDVAFPYYFTTARTVARHELKERHMFH